MRRICTALLATGLALSLAQPAQALNVLDDATAKTFKEQELKGLRSKSCAVLKQFGEQAQVLTRAMTRTDFEAKAYQSFIAINLGKTESMTTAEFEDYSHLRAEAFGERAAECGLVIEDQPTPPQPTEPASAPTQPGSNEPNGTKPNSTQPAAPQPRPAQGTSSSFGSS